MRVLWMKSDYVAPPDTGGKIRTYNLMRELNRLCPLTYLAFKPDLSPNTEPEIQAVATQVHTVHKPEENKSGPAFYARVLLGMCSRLPYIVRKYRSAEVLRQQRQFVQSDGEPAVILCDFLEMAENVDWSLPCPKVLFQHNVESMIYERYYANETNPLKKAYFNYERKRMRRYETDACNRFDLVFAVSEADKQLLQEDFAVTTPIEVLETGVNTDYFSAAPAEEAQPGKLLFLGSMDWMPNIDAMKWFVQQVYPQIRAANPQVSLDIVGRRPVGEVRKLAENDDSIQVIADVPDVRPYVRQSDIFIVPIRIGGGTRIKIYEAMAMRRPVVSTTIGAEGLPLTPGQHIAIGDSPEELAGRIGELLSDQDKKNLLAEAGYSLVTERYQWQNVAVEMRDRCLGLLK